MVQVRGGKVRPHVQAWADACSAATGADNFGTYNGHSPSIDRALDIFTPLESRALGDAICAFAIEHLDDYGVDYVIYRQRIYNPEIAPYWREMADRGDPTQNHMDHVHVSFEPSASPSRPTPRPAPPTPDPEEVTMIIYRAAGSAWLYSATGSRLVAGPGDYNALVGAGVKDVGDLSDQQHDILRAATRVELDKVEQTAKAASAEAAAAEHPPRQ